VSVVEETSPRVSAVAAPPAHRVLRKLFLTLFLRGRSSRGLKKETAPKSVGHKLAMTLGFYGLIGLMALVFLGQPVFAVAVYLHAMTFVFLGMFVAASAGEILFNKEEADILLHRPVGPRMLLWAKIQVLVEISLWLGAAFNLAGIFMGLSSPDGNWLFPVAHAVSTVLEALFCTGCVVMVYQLCLRWFGRERLEGLMTTAQVIVSVAAVLAGQLLPQMVFRTGRMIHLDAKSLWLALLPPAWFAGFDDAVSGGGAKISWLLAGLAVVVTAGVLWGAFGKLAKDYQTGLQALGETVSRRRRGPRWLDGLVNAPPLRWWLRDPVERAAFLLSAAYLARDRDVKLRIYPGVAPFLVVPFVLMVNRGGSSSAFTNGFGVAFVAAYVGLIPMMAVGILQYSAQWQAADIFRAAPVSGPAPLCHGARRAIIFFVAMPMVVAFAVFLWLFQRDVSQLAMLLPGIIAMPVYAILPSLQGGGVPLSLPPEEAKSAGRGVAMVSAMLVSMAISGVALMARYFGVFWWLIGLEIVVAGGIYFVMRRNLNGMRWEAMD
jgi:hypothetical protein